MLRGGAGGDEKQVINFAWPNGTQLHANVPSSNAGIYYILMHVYT